LRRVRLITPRAETLRRGVLSLTRAPGSRSSSEASALAVGELVERERVHAVAQPGRGRAVGEDVTEVGLAHVAARLDADHPVALVHVIRDDLGEERRGERRPAGAGLEL